MRESFDLAQKDSGRIASISAIICMANSPRYLERKSYERQQALFQFRTGWKSRVFQVHSTAMPAYSRIEGVEFLQHFQCGHILEHWLHADTSDQLPDQCHLFTLGPVAEKSVMPDSDESVRKDMHEESPDELFRRETKDGRVSGPVVLYSEGDGLVCHFQNPAVGNGDVMGVATEVFNHVCSTFEGLLEMGDPFLGIERGQEIIELGRISEHSL